MRDTIFISHANPEDNDFALWLTLRLAGLGYPTWCDLTKLLGGEDFWADIETVLRDRTVKFLYVLSRTSSHRHGAVQELALAQAVAKSNHFRDFVIPLKIDDLPHGEMNIRLNNLNAVPFHQGWAVGLQRLIKKLEDDGVPQSPDFSPTVVTAWWRAYHSAHQGVVEQPEEYLTNWFPVGPLPETLHLHHLVRYGGGITEPPISLPYPAVKHGAYLITFAPAEDLQAVISPPHMLDGNGSVTCPLSMFLDGKCQETQIHRQEARNHVTNLLRQSWELELQRRELPVNQLSGGAKCCYFTRGLAEQDRVYFTGIDGRRSYRQMVGYSTVSRRPGQEPTKRYWHFGIQLKPMLYPVIAFAAKPHVLFSSDGEAIWDSPRRLHQARRSECKQWWNPEWRDRILAAITWLANEMGEISFPISSSSNITISPRPLMVVSPVSFSDPERSEAPIDVDQDEEWDEDDADEEDL